MKYPLLGLLGLAYDGIHSEEEVDSIRLASETEEPWPPPSSLQKPDAAGARFDSGSLISTLVVPKACRNGFTHY